MKIKLSRTDTYVPKWNGNRELPEAERVSVDYRYMTCEEEEKWSVIRPIFSEGETKEVKVDYATHANEIWLACVKAVHGLTDMDGAPVSDAKAVLKVPGIYGFVTEVVAEIKRGILTEQDSKNSE